MKCDHCGNEVGVEDGDQFVSSSGLDVWLHHWCWDMIADALGDEARLADEADQRENTDYFR